MNQALFVILKAIGVYAGGLALIRLGKKRLLKGMSAFDILLVVILGSVLSRAINGSSTIVDTFAASITLVACHWLLSYLSCRFHWIGLWVKGKDTIVISNGILDELAANSEHLSPHDI